jgi:hypothetical protein
MRAVLGTGRGISGWLRSMRIGRSANPSQWIWENVGEGGIGTNGWGNRGNRVETEADVEVLITSQDPQDWFKSCCVDSRAKQLQL